MTNYQLMIKRDYYSIPKELEHNKKTEKIKRYRWPIQASTVPLQEAKNVVSCTFSIKTFYFFSNLLKHNRLVIYNVVYPESIIRLKWDRRILIISDVLSFHI